MSLTRREFLRGAAFAGLAALGSGCESQPVSQAKPTTQAPSVLSENGGIPTPVKPKGIQTTTHLLTLTYDQKEEQYYGTNYDWRNTSPSVYRLDNVHLKGDDGIFRGPIEKLTIIRATDLMGITPDQHTEIFTPEPLSRVMKVKGDFSGSFVGELTVFRFNHGRIDLINFLPQEESDSANTPINSGTETSQYVDLKKAWQVENASNGSSQAQYVGDTRRWLAQGGVLLGDIGYRYLKVPVRAFPTPQ